MTVRVITVTRNGAVAALFRLTDVSVSPLLAGLEGNADVAVATGAFADLALLTATASLKLSPAVTLEIPSVLSPMLSRVNVAPDDYVMVLRRETRLPMLLVRVLLPGNRAVAFGKAQSEFVGTPALARQLLALSVVEVMTAPNADFGGHSREAMWPTSGSPRFVESLPQVRDVVPALRAVSPPGLQSGASITVRT